MGTGRKDSQDTLLLASLAPLYKFKSLTKTKQNKIRKPRTGLLSFYVSKSCLIFPVIPRWFGDWVCKRNAQGFNASLGLTSAPAVSPDGGRVMAPSLSLTQSHLLWEACVLPWMLLPLPFSNYRIMTCRWKLCWSQGEPQVRNCSLGTNPDDKMVSPDSALADYAHAWIISHVCAFCKTFTAVGSGKKPPCPFLSWLTEAS